MMTRLMTAAACLCLALALPAGAEDKKTDKPTGDDFSNKDLTKMNFANKVFKDNSTFEDSDLTGVSFNKATVRNAVFVGADLTRANMYEADLTGADFRKAKVDKVSWAYATLVGVNWEGLDMSGTFFYEPNLRGANLRNLKGIGKVTRGTFAGADLRGANLSRLTPSADGTKTNFSKAKYDKDTRWPEGFDPKEAGAILVTEEPKK